MAKPSRLLGSLLACPSPWVPAVGLADTNFDSDLEVAVTIGSLQEVYMPSFGGTHMMTKLQEPLSLDRDISVLEAVQRCKSMRECFGVSIKLPTTVRIRREHLPEGCIELTVKPKSGYCRGICERLGPEECTKSSIKKGKESGSHPKKSCALQLRQPSLPLPGREVAFWGPTMGKPACREPGTVGEWVTYLRSPRSLADIPDPSTVTTLHNLSAFSLLSVATDQNQVRTALLRDETVHLRYDDTPLLSKSTEGREVYSEAGWQTPAFTRRLPQLHVRHLEKGDCVNRVSPHFPPMFPRVQVVRWPGQHFVAYHGMAFQLAKPFGVMRFVKRTGRWDKSFHI